MATTADQPTGEEPRRQMVDLPAAELPPRTIIVACAGCQGHGKVRMSVHDVLSESITLIADNPDPVIKRFYGHLFTINPVLKAIFPPDLLNAPAHAAGSQGAHQRDQLVGALVKVSTLYGGGHREEQELVAILRQAGRSHAALEWPDGRVGPPLPQHWQQVKKALFETLAAVAGDQWRDEYTAAWSEAYDFAETEMRHAIQHEGRELTVARQPRRTAEHGGGRDWRS